MKNNLFTITVKDGKVGFNQEAPCSFQDLVAVMLSILEGNAEYIIQHAKEEIIDDPDAEQIARDTLFDLLNVAFSSSLGRIDPEDDLHPTLTAKAIREAEDRIITEGRLTEVKKGS